MQLATPVAAICALPVVPAPPTTMPAMPFVSVVAAITAVEGAPVIFASLFAAVPVTPSLATSRTREFALPRSRFAPRAPEMVGDVMVGFVSRTILLLPVVPLPEAVPVNVGLEMVGLVASTTAPAPVVPFVRSRAAGCAADGTPLVEIPFRNMLGCGVNAWTPPNVEALGFGIAEELIFPLPSKPA